MQDRMILYNGPTSPFGRKTKIVSLIHKIKLKEKIINVYESEFLDKYNPIRKIPTLINKHMTIVDSDNICLYFDSISKKKTLFPKKDYWKIISITSIANGLMEAILERRMELIRPKREKSKNFINKQEKRINRTISWLESNWNNYNEKYLTMDQIAIACSLDYATFRFNNEWKVLNPKLNIWFNSFKKKDFMKMTLPKKNK